jgi:hypothetical protein
MSERCSRCGKPEPITLYLQTRDGVKQPLCQTCAEKFLNSDEEFPQPTPRLVQLWLQGKTKRKPPEFMLKECGLA